MYEHITYKAVYKRFACVESFLNYYYCHPNKQTQVRGTTQQSGPLAGNGESRCIRHESPLGGIQMVVLFNQ